MRLLRVDLTSGKFADQLVPKDDLLKYMGGRGLAAKVLYQENKTKIDAFDPENRLIFMTGPYTGTYGSFTGFYNVTTKSPLTGAILSAHSGGHWGPMLRRTGYDGIVLFGRAPKPVYLLLTDDGAELRTAADLWGKDVFETIDALEERHHKAKATVIGPAGEKRARIAAIMNDHHRAAGRGGAGAVMGSKNLKAIVVHGTKEVPQADPDRLKETFKEATKTVKEKSAAFAKYGTSMVVGITGKAGVIPTKNLHTGYFPDFEKIGGDALINEHFVKNMACARCPLHCGNKTKAEKDYKVETEGPEYETLAMFGANLENSNLESIIMANDLCNRYGIDTISCADTIACAVDMFDKNIISEKETGGIRLSWGDHETMVRLVEMTGKGEGFGTAIGEGSKRLAATYGPEAEKCSMNVKGMEFPGYDPRGIQGMSLAFATSTRGACHLRATMYVPELFQGTADRFTVKGKAKPLKDMQELFTVLDCMVLCKFGARNAFANSWDNLAMLVNAATGHGYDVDGLRQVGERVWTLERLFNLREGLSKKDDTLPDRLFTVPIHDGPSKGAVVNRTDFESELEAYYAVWGWSPEGIPTPETIERLGLGL
ncbi:MAG: aldehyde ferredoxin oxidoreductase family protein [Candidatus Thermoplasmatota archaeon]|nr:aldehyde ferredoxin oxidoreductase family protein [Candidatus Thermoplasmatota archaeon]